MSQNMSTYALKLKEVLLITESWLPLHKNSRYLPSFCCILSFRVKYHFLKGTGRGRAWPRQCRG